MIVAVFFLVAALNVPSAPAETGPGTVDDLFVTDCAACHTIGGGDGDGPDLAPATRWSDADLRAAVERMSENVVTMTPGQIADMVSLLRSPDVTVRLAAARRRVAASTAPAEPGSAVEGRALFSGSAAFSNGGLPCASCHAYEGNGGSLAVALDGAAARIGRPSLLKAAESPPWAVMRAAYGKRPVTKPEAAHLAAFLAGERPGSGTTVRDGPPVLPALALLGASTVSLALALRRRNHGARAALERAAPKR